MQVQSFVSKSQTRFEQQNLKEQNVNRNCKNLKIEVPNPHQVKEVSKYV